MLSFEITDLRGRKTSLGKPLRLSIVSSQDAPADSLSAVFEISGNLPTLKSIRVSLGPETVFFGEIDEQSDIVSGTQHRMSLRARSREAVLLDNEARPQQYFMPSMPLLMKRHFAPLGFTEFIGDDSPFNGELMISKGESEWDVLCAFCEKFLRVEPRLTENGVIDVSGKRQGAVLLIGRSHQVLSVRRTLRRSAVISDIYARTYHKGGYETHIENSQAQRLGVRRVRYVSSVNSKTRSVLETRALIPKANAKARLCELVLAGSVLCRVGDELRMEGDSEIRSITEVHYVYSDSGEQTRIYAEVKEDVAG